MNVEYAQVGKKCAGVCRRIWLEGNQFVADVISTYLAISMG